MGHEFFYLHTMCLHICIAKMRMQILCDLGIAWNFLQAFPAMYLESYLFIFETDMRPPNIIHIPKWRILFSIVFNNSHMTYFLNVVINISICFRREESAAVGHRHLHKRCRRDVSRPLKVTRWSSDDWIRSFKVAFQHVPRGLRHSLKQKQQEV